MIEQEKKLPPITEELIEELRKKHRKLYRYNTTDGRSLIFRAPTINELDAAGVAAKKSPLNSNRILAKSCALAGDSSILTDTDAFVGLGEKLQGIIEKVEGELSEL